MAGTQQSCEVLVLGANGKLGRMLCGLWHPQDWRLVPVVRPGRSGRDTVTWAPNHQMPNRQGVKAIVALWGVTPGPGRDLGENASLARAAIDLGESLAAEVVVHCSSAAVYRPAPGPLAETTPPDPQSDYGLAKMQMEEVIEASRDKVRARQIILRIGNVAGADSLFGNLRAGGQVVLDDFGQHEGPARSYIAPQDLARVIEALIGDPAAQGVFNVAAPRPTRMADLVRAAGATIRWRAAPPAAFPMMWLDTGRLSQQLELSETSAEAGWLVSSAAEAVEGRQW